MLEIHGKNLEELIKTLYTELYLSVSEISQITKLYYDKVYNTLWRLRVIRTPVQSRKIREQLKHLSEKQKAEYIHKARQLGVPYRVIAKVLGIKQKEVKSLERSLSSKV